MIYELTGAPNDERRGNGTEAKRFLPLLLGVVRLLFSHTQRTKAACDERHSPLPSPSATKTVSYTHLDVYKRQVYRRL